MYPRWSLKSTAMMPKSLGPDCDPCPNMSRWILYFAHLVSLYYRGWLSMENWYCQRICHVIPDYIPIYPKYSTLLARYTIIIDGFTTMLIVRFIFVWWFCHRFCISTNLSLRCFRRWGGGSVLFLVGWYGVIIAILSRCWQFSSSVVPSQLLHSWSWLGTVVKQLMACHSQGVPKFDSLFDSLSFPGWQVVSSPSFLL